MSHIETCHNKKKKVPIIPLTIVKSIKHVAKTKTQLIKPTKIPIRYPYIIYYITKHKFGELRRNTIRF